MDIFSSRSAVIMDDNQIMIRPASSPLRRIFQAPFSRRTWAELAYAFVSALLAAGAVIFIVPMLVNGLLWGLSASGVRKLSTAARSLDRALLGDDVPAPPQLRSMPIFMVRTPDAARLAVAAGAAGGRIRVWDSKPGVTVKKLSRPGSPKWPPRRVSPSMRCGRPAPLSAG